MRSRALLVTTVVLAACGVAAPAAPAALPVISYSLSGTAGANGWFVSTVTVNWTVQGQPLSSSGCEAAVLVTADTTGTTRSCTASNADGTTTVATRVIKIDKTPPAVTGATPARPPDTNGWYRSPVAIAWTGTDATSGIASCASATYAGPDGAAAPVGTCTDAAGNVSSPLAFPLQYDATAPALAGVSAAAGDAVTTLRWAAAPDAQQVTITRAPGVRGAASSVVFTGLGDHFVDTRLRNRVRYRYTVTATDAAGNATSADAVARPTGRLVAPLSGARLGAPPVLRWKRLKRARYYNVQLFRGSRKVLSAWPTRPRLQLRRTWRFRGHRQRLVRGRYRWYVWPGLGPRSRNRYGRLLGVREFVIR
jgi:hypothetical protein